MPTNSTYSDEFAVLHNTMQYLPNLVHFVATTCWACAVNQVDSPANFFFVDYFSAKRTRFFIIAGKGGGVIQGTASEAVLVVMLAARKRALKQVSSAAQGMSEAEALSKLVVYSSDQTHSCVIKACQVPNLLA